jgi:dolichol-phosphate mannosyltransferase
MVRLAVVVPTYQEAENVVPLLDRLAKVAGEHPDDALRVLVVDDSSPDGTAALVRSLAPELADRGLRVDVLERAEKNGLGRAYVEGMQHVLADGDVDAVLQMDADLSHDPAYVHDFLAHARAGADLVVASRYVPGGATPDWGWHRKALSRGGNWYARLLLGHRLSDYTGGFNLYAADLLRRMDLTSVGSAGYAFQIEMKTRALRLTERVVQVPIVFLDRTAGSSKIPRSTLLTSLRLVTRLGLRRLLGR